MQLTIGVLTNKILSGRRFFLVLLNLIFLFSNYAYAQKFNDQEVYALTGTGLLEYDKKEINITDKKIPFTWKSVVFKTDNLSSLIIRDVDSGKYGLLPRSTLRIIPGEDEFDLVRHLKLETGSVRFKGSGKISDTSKNKALIEQARIDTTELIITVPRGGDVGVLRGFDKSKNKYFTKAMVINGWVSLSMSDTVLKKLAQRNNQKQNSNSNEKITLNAGLEFTIFDDGGVLPVGVPDKSFYESVVVFSKTQDDSLIQSKTVSIDEVKKICFDYLNTGEFFEIVQEVGPRLSYFKNDAELFYCTATGYKELFQFVDAKKYYNKALELDRTHGPTHWALAQIDLEEKKYSDAIKKFDQAQDELPSSLTKAREIYYYRGVARFYNQELLDAKKDFSVAIYDDKIDPALKASAASFLNKIDVDSAHSIIVPVGVQYDNNVLGLSKNDALPSDFSSESTWRAIMGTIYTYDPSRATKQSGSFYGFGGRAFYVKHLTGGYSSLDSITAEVNAFQTTRKDEKEKSTQNKIYGNLGLIFVDQKQDNLYFVMGNSKSFWDLNLALEYDISTREADSKKTGLVFNQSADLVLGKLDSWIFLTSLNLKEKLFFKTNDSQGHFVELIFKPSATYNITDRFNVKGMFTGDFTWTFTKPLQTVYKYTPGLGAGYFIKTWLMATAEGGYEITYKNDKSEAITRPTATVMFTGIF